MANYTIEIDSPLEGIDGKLDVNYDSEPPEPETGYHGYFAVCWVKDDKGNEIELTPEQEAQVIDAMDDERKKAREY